MEVPLEDFEHLPQELGCSVESKGTRLSLLSGQPGCAMHFRIEGRFAVLEAIDVRDDPHGSFFRDVVGLVFQLYSGDLEADLTWSPRGALEERVQIRAGETSHPLLFQPVEDDLDAIERWLDEAQQAWGDYQRHKQTRESKRGDLT